MSGDLVGLILRRIDRRQRTLRANSGERVSDRSVSLAAGLSADYLRSLRRQYERGTQVGVTTPAIAAIARALKTTPEWLLHGLGSEQPGPSGDRVEIRLCWNIIPDGDHFIVEEEFDNQPVRRWGPVPTRESARALIQERIRQPNLLQDALKHKH
jgi:transcriptional regulator with XRE-family HTH domain